MCKKKIMELPIKVRSRINGDRLSKTSFGRSKCEHGVIQKIVASNICGSDQHMVRGRTTAEKGLVLDMKRAGEAQECGRDVEFIKTETWFRLF
jgi:threonine dehydrogenase-like Zn-dependent dehydrogenase